MNKKEIVFVPKNSLTPSVLANYILRNADEFSYPNNYFLGFKYDDEIYIFSVVQKPYGENDEELIIEIEKLKDEIREVIEDIEELKALAKKE